MIKKMFFLTFSFQLHAQSLFSETRFRIWTIVGPSGELAQWDGRYILSSIFCCTVNGVVCFK